MNRTDRLYALVEELRAIAPRPRSATWLARRFEVSVRTIERDLDALRQSGVVIRGDVGRAGGYFLDRDRTLPPVTLTAREALAISVALRSVGAGPFASAARTAGQKVLAVLPTDVRAREARMAEQIHVVGEHPAPASGPVIEAIETGLESGRVLHLVYLDPHGAQTERDVEPMGLLWGPRGWYLMAWCRLRRAVRGFELLRVDAATVTDEVVAPREDAARLELDRLSAQPLVP